MTADIIHITDPSAPELAAYAHLNENQLRHYYEPAPGIFIGESPNVILRGLDAGYEPVSLLTEEKYIETEAAPIIERLGAVPVYTAPLPVLSQITGYHLTRGILCAFRRKPLPSVTDICRGARRIAVLENIENPTNVGAVFRSAAALGVDAVLLTKDCSDPLYRRTLRVSVGTVFQVPWTYFPGSWPEEGLSLLRELGFETAAMALRDDTVRIDDPKLHAAPKLAIVLGNEGDGLAAKTIADCDYTVRIPMAHGVDSLNAAAAGAVAFYELCRK